MSLEANGELQPILLGVPMKMWGLDVLGPFPESRVHQHYVLLAID